MLKGAIFQCYIAFIDERLIEQHVSFNTRTYSTSLTLLDNVTTYDQTVF